MVYFDGIQAVRPNAFTGNDVQGSLTVLPPPGTSGLHRLHSIAPAARVSQARQPRGFLAGMCRHAGARRHGRGNRPRQSPGCNSRIDHDACIARNVDDTVATPRGRGDEYAGAEALEGKGLG